MPGSVAAAVELSDQNEQNISLKKVNAEEHCITVPLISHVPARSDSGKLG